MTGYFTVVPPELTTAAADAREIGAGLRAELDRLRRRADAMLTTEWLGRAAEAFDRAWSDWRAGAGAVLAALEALADEVDRCAVGYAGADREGVELLTRAAP